MAKEIVSTMSGTVVSVLIKVGELVSSDQDVMVLESMKMEMPVVSMTSGVVREIKVATDDFVQEGQVVVVLE